MSTSTDVVLIMALLLLWTTVPFSSSFTPPSNRQHSTSSSSRIIVSSVDLDDGVSDTRRDIIRFTIASVLAIAPFVSWDAHNPAIVLPPSAFAIQEKNEVLWYVILFCLILYLIHLGYITLHFKYIIHHTLTSISLSTSPVTLGFSQTLEPGIVSDINFFCVYY